MTTSSDPKASATPQAPQAAQTPEAKPEPEPKCSMLALCVECGQGIELPLPFDQRGLSYMLAQVGWFISVLSPPGQQIERVVIGPLCGQCAQKVYPPEVYTMAEQRRQQLLQAFQQGAQPPPPPPPATTGTAR
jgi:hypothetical protein